MKKFILTIAILALLCFVAARVLAPELSAKEAISNFWNKEIKAGGLEELIWSPKEGEKYPQLNLISISGQSYPLINLKRTHFIIVPIDMRSASSQVQVGAYQIFQIQVILLKL